MTKPDQPPRPHDRQPSVACPHCAAHAARPVSVVTDKGNPNIVHITMHCRDCQQSWIVPKLAYDDLPV